MVWYDDEDNSCQKAVIDNGTGYLKGGLAGEPEPSHMYRACVGYVKPGEGGEVPKVINGEPAQDLSLIHISEPTRLLSISYAVFCLKKKKKNPDNEVYKLIVEESRNKHNRITT
eukprot:TRINITY_DN13221_c0_g1_i1.p2 TRINITY_DN13221_c0_g1~~TRINITY_DN13221_c0_g1_i1.p2  ORF type:complete len:114 (+),score=26.81 TRINITY_DN13221_c0_g1_i1:232-573(+)